MVLIPVPEADFVVRPRLERFAPEHLPVDPDDTAAHITLLAPFTVIGAAERGLVAELRELFADVVQFPFRLTEISRFPGGTTYLSPEPAGPFRQLTHELMKLFPEFPPYGGAFEDIVPHLSVPVLDGEDPDTLRRELGSRFPIGAHAREAALFWREPGASRTLETFSFGTTAA